MRITRISAVGFLAFLTSGAANVVDAQVSERPPRAFRGLFGGSRSANPARSRQELTLSSNFLGGFDDNLNPQGGGGIADLLVPQQSGYTGFGDLSLRYWRGDARRSLTIDGRGYGTAYSIGGTAPALGANLNVEAASDFARRNRMEFAQNVSSEPFVELGAYGSIDADVGADAPDNNPTNGLGPRRSWSMSSTASYSRRWTPRRITSMTYNYMKRDYADAFGYDNATHTAQAGYEHGLRRGSSLQTSYQYAHATFVDTGGHGTPMQDHSLTTTYQYEKRFSSTRTMSFAAGMGATHSTTISSITREPRKYWAPNGHGTVRLDIGRSWNISGDYRRALTVLDGISPQAFYTNAAMARVGGFLLGPRLDAMLSAAYADGQASEGQNEAGRYRSYNLGVQVRSAFSSWCATVVSYSYYDYQLGNVVNLPAGFPTGFSRHAVRVGLTLWVPLYGSYTDRPRGGGTSGGR
jgi:hypothetical protein